jgi:hypothetical protein
LASAGFYRANIIASVGGESVGLWVADSYLIMVVCLGPAISRMGDALGRRYLSIFGAFCGFLGCLIIAVANRIGIVIFGCCVFGVAFSMLGNTFAIAGEGEVNLR